MGWCTPSTAAASRSSASSNAADEDFEVLSSLSAQTTACGAAFAQLRLAPGRPAWADILDDDIDLDEDVWSDVWSRTSTLSISPAAPEVRTKAAARPIRLVKGAGGRERCDVFVTNLPKNASEADLRSAFDRFGRITSISIARDGRGQARGHGTVTFTDSDATLAAVARCEAGRLALTDSTGQKCQIGGSWAELTSQVAGQHQQSDKGTRRRQKKESQDRSTR